MTIGDIQLVACELLSRADFLIPQWLPAGKYVGREWVARNPTRQDAHLGSFKVNLDTGVWCDFATGDKGGDVVSLYAYLEGVKQGEAAKRLAEAHGLNDKPYTARPGAEGRAMWEPLTPIPANAPPPPQAHPRHGKPSRSWTYRNEQGAALCHVLRFDLPEGKQIVPLTYCRNEKGETAWRWQGLPEPRSLYHLDKLAANPQATVILCEGEKAADACSELFPDCVSTTTLNGSQSPHKTDFAPLAGRTVWLWPDNDDPGRKYADKVAGLLKEAGAREIKLLHVPGDYPPGWDAADALAEGWQASRGFELLDAAKARIYGKKVYPYVVADNAIHYIKHTREGDVEVPLCNFDARITQEIIHDDGAEVQSLFLIEGVLANGRELAAIEVTTTSFAGLSWVTSYWGNSPVVYAGSSLKDHLRCAIQRLSGSVPRCTIFGHYGWRKVDNGWYYLHAGGALGASGNRTDIEVSADKGAMRLYCLPDPPKGDDRVKAVRASLRLKDIGRSKVAGYVLLAATYRAPLGEAYRVDLSLFLAGYTGLMKSEMTAIALAHFGQEFTARNFPASFEDTETDLEMKSFRAKDAVFVVDDFKPKGGESDIHRLHAKADRLFRGAGNQSGRGRRTSTLQARPAYYPRGFVLSSGEDIPRGQSLRARLCIVEVKPGEVDKAVMAEMQQAAATGLLSQAMGGYIAWLAPRMGDLKETLPDEIRAYRTDSSKYAHTRFIDNYANLIIGLGKFLAYAADMGAITVTEKETLLAEGTEALDNLMHNQADYQADADESTRFFALLTSALVSDRCHLVDVHSQGEPSNPRDCGWRQFFVRDKDGNDELKWRPIGTCLGWTDDVKLYLDPEATFAVIQKFASEQKEPFPVSQRTLWKRLADKGLLMDRDLSDGKNRTTGWKKIDGKSRRVCIILKASLPGSCDEEISGDRDTTKKISGDRQNPHGAWPEDQSHHRHHYSADRPATFSRSRDDGTGQGPTDAQAADEKTSGGYVINSGISGDRGIKANADAVSSGHHSRISVVTGDKLVVTGDGLPETARVYEALLQLNGRPVDGLRLAGLLGRSVESIEPALDELARRGVIKPKGVGWLTSPVILQVAGGEP